MKTGFDCGSRFLLPCVTSVLTHTLRHQSLTLTWPPWLSCDWSLTLLHDRPVRRRSTVSKRTTFTKSGRPHVYAPIQMHDVITSPKSKNKNYQTTRRQYIWRRMVRLHCLFTDYSFTVKLLPTSLTKAVRRLVESPYSLTPYQSTRRHYHIHIPHFIPWLSTQLRTAFFREVASSFTIN